MVTGQAQGIGRGETQALEGDFAPQGPEMMTGGVTENEGASLRGVGQRIGVIATAMEDNEGIPRRRAIYSRPAESVFNAVNGATEEQRRQNAAEIGRIVAAENGELGAGSEGGEEFVGASAKEINDRLEGDLEDLKLETGEGLAPEEEWQHRLLTENQEKLTDEAVEGIDRLLKGDWSPLALEVERYKLSLKMRDTYNNQTRGRL